MKKVLFLLISVLILCTLISCGTSSETTTADIIADTTAQTSAETTQTQATTTTTTAKITTTPITTTAAPTVTTAPAPTEVAVDESFTVILPASASEAELSAAKNIVTALERMKITLAIKDDTTPVGANEILIGKTTREASIEAAKTLTEGGFHLTVRATASGTTVTLAAIDDIGIELAADYFTFTYLNSKGSATLPTALSLTHTRADATVNGIPLSSYTLVYAKDGVGGDVNIQTAKYKDTAAEFIALVEKATGKTITAIPDTEDFSSYEHILYFGNTSALDDNKMFTSKLASGGVKSYAAKTLSEHIGLAGMNPVSSLAAGEAFLYNLFENNNTITELNLSGKKDIIHVACIGDSITYGTGSDDPSVHSYPVYYQRMLGYDYYVEKYGAPSNSLIETDSPTFLTNSLYDKSVKAKPDVVIIMLGTNDCRPQRWADSAHKDWRDGTRKEAFIAAGQKMVDAYRGANADVQIIFATCPIVPQDQSYGTDWTTRLMTYGNPAIKQIAKNANCDVIDIFSYTKDNKNMFAGGDGLHLKNEKYEELAAGFYLLTKDIIKK